MDIDLLTQVAELYYLQEMNQLEIAKMLGISRPTISRLLSEAKKEGLVEINIKSSLMINHELSKQLRDKLPLKNALIVSGNYGYRDALKHSSEAAASFVLSVMADGDTLGVAWGEAVNFFSRALREKDYTSSTVAQMAGCLSTGNPSEDGFELALHISEKLHCKYSNINSPLFLDNKMVYEHILGESSINASLNKAKRANIAVTGIGAISPRSLLTETGYISDQEMQDAASAGADGQILGQAFTSNGDIIQWDSKYAVAVPITFLRSMRWTIGICAGAYKAEAALASIKAGYINTLAADELLAKSILEKI